MRLFSDSEQFTIMLPECSFHPISAEHLSSQGELRIYDHH